VIDGEAAVEGAQSRLFRIRSATVISFTVHSHETADLDTGVGGRDVDKPIAIHAA
jgi:hypothetical protein